MLDLLPHGGGVSVGLHPVNLLSAAVNSRWCSVKDVNKMLNIAIITAIGTAGDDIVVNLQQATDLAGTGAKALNIERLHRKTVPLVAATPPALDPDDVFTAITTVSNESPAASYDTDPYPQAESPDTLLIRVRPMDLDVANGFNCVRVQILQTASAQLCTVIYIPEGMAYQGADAPGVLFRLKPT